MTKKREEDLMNVYVSSIEDENPIIKQATITSVANAEQQYPNMSDIARENRTHGNPNIPVNGDAGLNYKDNLGYLKIPIETLPTSGFFYPDGVEIAIRAARGEEIKHWSTMNDQDVQQLSKTDDILNYMIERCVSVKIPNKSGNCWKDLKNVDRFYILLAVKEYTFIDGENELLVPDEDGNDISIVKDMIDFINIPEELMKHYNPDAKCFIFNVDSKIIKMHIPSIGVNLWLKEYATRKINSREVYDQDFLEYAPMLISDYRELNQRSYEELVASTRIWGVKEWSVVSYVVKLLSDVSEPKIKLNSGMEIPLTFRDGLKSIFLLSNPLLKLC